MEDKVLMLVQAFDGVAPLVSAVMTAFIMKRYFEGKEKKQISEVEAALREFLEGQLREVREELHECEKARAEDQKVINKLSQRVQELEWINSRTQGEH